MQSIQMKTELISVRGILCVIALVLSALPFRVFAQCSADYSGLVSINEIHRSGNNTRFVELKLLDSSLNNSDYDGWTIQICGSGGGCTGGLSLSSADDSNLPWIVVPKSSISSKKYINLSGGTEVLLTDANGDTIDYVSVAGYKPNIDATCLSVFPWQPSGTNSHTVERDPDGVGDWGSRSGNSGNNSSGDNNNGDGITGPDISITSTMVVQGEVANVTVSLSSTVGSDITFDYTTLDNSATAGVDYQSASGSGLIASGLTSTTLSIPTLATGSSSVSRFYVQLTSTNNANIVGQLAVVTILPPVWGKWQMDEVSWNGTAGEVIDSSSNGYHGTAVNGAATASVSPAISGDPGTCNYGVFDDAGGSNGDYIEIDSFPNLTSDFTMTSWVRTEDRTRAGQRIFADDQSNSQGYAVSIGDPGSGRVRFYSRGISPITMDTSAVINNDTWYFVAAVADIANKQRTLYIYASDGTLLNTTQASYTGTWGVDSGPASVGGETNSGETNNRFKGNIDEVRMYAGALSQTYISSILSETHPCNAGALSHLAFEQTAWSGAGVTIDDASGNGNTGISVGNAESHAAGYFCKGAMIPDNSEYSTIDAINSQQDINDTMGNEGTIMLWYRAEQDWVGSGNRILMDATSSIFGNSSDKYFALSKQNDGQLRFALEDSADSDFNLYTGANTITAGTWVHVAVTWDMPNNEIKIYVNGSESATQSVSSNGVLGDLGPVYFGDNSSTYAVVSGNSANGRLDEIKLYDNVLTAAEITTEMGDSHTCTSCVLGSFDITQPSSGLACPSTRSSISIQAMCTDGSTQKTDYAGTIDFSSNENANSDFYAVSAGGATINSITLDGSEGGAVNVYLFHKNENSDLKVTASDSVASVSSAAANGSDFRTSGLVASTPASFVCGNSSAMTLTAIGQTESGSGVCSVLTGFTGNKNLKAWFTVNHDPFESPGLSDNPNTGLGLAGTVITNTTQPAANNLLSLGFSSGVANFNVTHLDVGEILGIDFLHDEAPYDGSASGINALNGSTSGFVVTPSQINVSATAANSACVSGDHTCSKFVSAGSNFDMQASAVCADTSVTVAQSYESTVPLSLSLVAPVSGAVGLLTVTSVAFNDAANGNVVETGQQISEVGVFTITATPPNYFGQTILLTTSANIGRFIPDYFEVTPSNGTLASTCGTFSYIGQNVGYSTAPSALIVAKNKNTGTTQNYTDTNFMKLGSGDITRTFSNADDDQRGQDNLTYMAVVSDMIQGSGTVVAGSNAGEMDYTFDPTDTFLYAKDSNSLIDQFTNKLTINASALMDDDSVAANVLPSWTPTGINLRYGRWNMNNVFGPETVALEMPAKVEYYDGSSFVVNLSDSCTNVSALVSLNPAPSSLPFSDIAVGSGTTAFSLNGPVSAGEAGFSFAIPTAGTGGVVEIAVNLSSLSWLQFDWNGDGSLQDDPNATATFGQYRGHDRIIYWREVQ